MKYAPCQIEPLEARIAPANITAVVVGHTLKVTGNSGDNDVELFASPTDSTAFAVASATDTINGTDQFNTPSGITGISIKLLGGDDTLVFRTATGPINVSGSLQVDCGGGSNTIEATDLTVGKNLSISYGKTISLLQTVVLNDLNVGGNVTMKSTAGNTEVAIQRDSAGDSSIGGNLTIRNGPGRDSTRVFDTNIGGNVTVNNGSRTGGVDGGAFQLSNYYNTSERSIIRGNVTVTFTDGAVEPSAIYDTLVEGNVAFNIGHGGGTLNFDGNKTSLPVVIDGSLTVKDRGLLTFSAGEGLQRTGLTVGAAIKIAGGDNGDTISFNKVQVGGTTSVTNGKGANSLTIDDSIFARAFTDTDKKGSDTVEIETGQGTSAPTIFERAVLIDASVGPVAVTLAGNQDSGQFLYCYSTFLVAHASNGGTLTQTPSHERFLFEGTAKIEGGQ